MLIQSFDFFTDVIFTKVPSKLNSSSFLIFIIFSFNGTFFCDVNTVKVPFNAFSNSVLKNNFTRPILPSSENRKMCIRDRPIAVNSNSPLSCE